MSAFKFVVCIPARYASTRLPGKPLIKLKGKELILWAAEAASQLGAEDVVVATDDQRIAAVTEAAGYCTLMTQPNHSTGTDRLAECAQLLDWDDDLWVLNYQGDEPRIPRANVERVLTCLQANPQASIGTLYQRIHSMSDLMNPSVVKLVTDQQQQALYFSRAPIPWSQSDFSQPMAENMTLPEGVVFKHHIGLYVYKAGFLKRFSQMPVSDLERIESLEQLRALSHGEVIVAAEAAEPMPHGIDTMDDVLRFEQS